MAALFGEDEVFSIGVVQLASIARYADLHNRNEVRIRAAEERVRSAQGRNRPA
jgi:hypothetical protein